MARPARAVSTSGARKCRRTKAHLLGARLEALDVLHVALHSVDLVGIDRVALKHAVHVGREHKMLLALQNVVKIAIDLGNVSGRTEAND